jgi:hypothetical protein
VAAHAQSLASVEAALAAEVDAIEHCSCMTENGPVLTDDLIERLATSEIVVGGVFGVRPTTDLRTAPVNVGPSPSAPARRSRRCWPGGARS